MTYLEAKAIHDALDADMDGFSKALKRFPSGPMGLTPDTVKASPEYRTAKAAYQKAFNRLREFNARFVRAFPDEIRSEREARRALRLVPSAP